MSSLLSPHRSPQNARLISDMQYRPILLCFFLLFQEERRAHIVIQRLIATVKAAILKHEQSKCFKMAVRPKLSRWALAAAGMFIITAATTATADEPSGYEIVVKFVELSGGEEAYAEIRNRVIESTLSLPDHGMEGEMSEFFAPPEYRRVISIDVYDENLDGVTGDIAWAYHPMDEPKILEGEEAVATRRQAQLNPFLDWTADSGEANLVGDGIVGEEACYRVALLPKNGSPIMAYFGKESGLLRRLDDRKANLFLYFDDYRELDGVLVPYDTRFEAGMMMADVTIVSIQQNIDLDDATFDLPPEIEILVE